MVIAGAANPCPSSHSGRTVESSGIPIPTRRGAKQTTHNKQPLFPVPTASSTLLTHTPPPPTSTNFTRNPNRWQTYSQMAFRHSNKTKNVSAYFNGIFGGRVTRSNVNYVTQHRTPFFLPEKLSGKQFTQQQNNSKKRFCSKKKPGKCESDGKRKVYI